MIAGIMELVKSLVFYLIFVTLVNHLIGDSVYSRYVKFFLGLLLMLLLITPVQRVFSSDDNLEYYLNWNMFKAQLEDADVYLEEADQNRDALLMSEYETTLKEQIKEEVEAAGYVFGDGKITFGTNEAFGRVENVKVWVGKKGREEGKITIEKVSLSDGVEIKADDLKKNIADTFQIKEGQVQVYKK